VSLDKELVKAVRGMKSPDLESLFTVVINEKTRRMRDKISGHKQKLKLEPYGFPAAVQIGAQNG
jgi:hypothetical protein